VGRQAIMTPAVPAPGQQDELEPYVTQALRDPAFRAAYENAHERHTIASRLRELCRWPRAHRGQR